MYSMKTVLITGAGRGLGKAIATKFLVASDALLILNTKKSALPEFETNKRCAVIKGDLLSDEIIQELAVAADDLDIDILINNAGVYLNKPFCEITNKEFENVLAINLLAPMKLTRSVWHIFKRKRIGLVININSITVKCDNPNEIAYAVSKCGLRGFSDVLRQDGMKDGICVVSIYLGAMKTEMVRSREGYTKFLEPSKAANLIFDISMGKTNADIDEFTISNHNRE